MAPAEESKLLSPFQLGKIQLENRVALAPLTRGRASIEHVPQPVMGDYYEQRADGNLIISEATGISRQGLGWYMAPGVWSEEQAAAWKPIVDKVRAKKGAFAMQLWHMGRQAHSDVTGEPIVSASAIAIEGEVTAREGEKKPYETPKPLSEEEIAAVVQDYRKAAANAVHVAGADFVELHAANGYLIDQFLQSKTNEREDGYGGSVENRLRLLREVLDEVIEEVGAERVGVRLSPNGAFGSMGSADFVETFTAAIDHLARKEVAFVHVMDGLGFGFHELGEPFTLEMTRDIIAKAGGSSAVIGNVGYTKELAEERIGAGHADLIAFGRPYISNPDLVQRFRTGAELAADAEYADWWTPHRGAKGYTDFPTAAEAAAAAASEE